MVTRNDEGTVQSKLIVAKTRVAPVKTVSLPRLKLCAALLATQLTTFTVAMLSLPSVSTIYWTDSVIVLCWISRAPSSWTVFVANRVSKIQATAPIEQWHHVSSAQNPADLLSRGVGGDQLEKNNLWWSGPQWLCLGSNHWPNINKREGTMAGVPERRISKVQVSTITVPMDILQKYSSFTRLSRVIAYCMRFCHNAKVSKSRRQVGEIMLEELDAAVIAIVRRTQQEAFQLEL
jgi:hypothetical protein